MWTEKCKKESYGWDYWLEHEDGRKIELTEDIAGNDDLVKVMLNYLNSVD